MSNEVNCVEKEEKECCVCKLIRCENCKKFLVVALGTFVGVFCALSLFTAVNKPMMPPTPHPFFNQGAPMIEMTMHRRHHFGEGEFKKHHNREMRAPEDDKKPEIEE